MKHNDDDLTLAYMTGYHKAMKEIASRTCENCRYGKITLNWNDEGIDVIDCSKLYKSFEDVGSFGCNKWSSKW